MHMRCFNLSHLSYIYSRSRRELYWRIKNVMSVTDAEISTVRGTCTSGCDSDAFIPPLRNKVTRYVCICIRPHCLRFLRHLSSIKGTRNIYRMIKRILGSIIQISFFLITPLAVFISVRTKYTYVCQNR